MLCDFCARFLTRDGEQSKAFRSSLNRARLDAIRSVPDALLRNQDQHAFMRFVVHNVPGERMPSNLYLHRVFEADLSR